MPQYTFSCNSCQRTFEITSSIKNYSPNQTCPHCSSKDVLRDYLADSSTPSIILSDDQIKLGHLAQRNSERFSDDKKAMLKEKNNAYRNSEPAGDLPSGMSRIDKPKSKPKWY